MLVFLETVIVKGISSVFRLLEVSMWEGGMGKDYLSVNCWAFCCLRRSL